MNVEELVPAVSKRVEFSLKCRKFVPVKPGCYVLATFSDEIVYVGLTSDLQRRFVEHRGTQSKCDPTVQGRAFWFYFLICREAETYRIERTWLNKYAEVHGALPVLNRVNSPVR